MHGLNTTAHGGAEVNGTPLQCSCLENPMDGGVWWATVHGVAQSRTWLSDFTFTFHFHALEEAMATQYSIILAWRIPGTGEPGGLPSMGSHRVGHDWSDLAAAQGGITLFNYNDLGQHRLYLKGPISCTQSYVTLHNFSLWLIILSANWRREESFNTYIFQIIKSLLNRCVSIKRKKKEK